GGRGPDPYARGPRVAAAGGRRRPRGPPRRGQPHDRARHRARPHRPLRCGRGGERGGGARPRPPRRRRATLALTRAGGTAAARLDAPGRVLCARAAAGARRQTARAGAADQDARGDGRVLGVAARRTRGRRLGGGGAALRDAEPRGARRHIRRLDLRARAERGGQGALVARAAHACLLACAARVRPRGRGVAHGARAYGAWALGPWDRRGGRRRSELVRGAGLAGAAGGRPLRSHLARRRAGHGPACARSHALAAARLLRLLSRRRARRAKCRRLALRLSRRRLCGCLRGPAALRAGLTLALRWPLAARALCAGGRARAGAGLGHALGGVPRHARAGARGGGAVGGGDERVGNHGRRAPAPPRPARQPGVLGRELPRAACRHGPLRVPAALAARARAARRLRPLRAERLPRLLRRAAHRRGVGGGGAALCGGAVQRRATDGGGRGAGAGCVGRVHGGCVRPGARLALARHRLLPQADAAAARGQLHQAAVCYARLSARSFEQVSLGLLGARRVAEQRRTHIGQAAQHAGSLEEEEEEDGNGEAAEGKGGA
ncbi:hypothetical protein T492DRAFT_901678, partial [Pavlovales sp. CCMP2436]